MNKLIDHTFNYLRFALLGIASAVFILGPAVYAQNQAQIDMPSTSYHGSTNFSKHAVYLNSNQSYIMQASTDWTEFWNCVIDNSASCGLGKGTICTVASAIIVTAIYALSGFVAVTALARQIGARTTKKAIAKLKKLLEKLPSTQIITIGGVDYTIPWGSLVSLLDGSMVGKLIQFLMLNDYAKAKRICKCLIC